MEVFNTSKKTNIPKIESGTNASKKKEVENVSKSENQTSGITSNIIQNSKPEENLETSTINQVSSINQKGGITANEVTIFHKKPPIPSKELIVQTLNSINPEILKLRKEGKRKICIMAHQYKITKLLEIVNKLKKEELLDIKTGSNQMIGNTNKMGNCINDVQDGVLNQFDVTFLEKFDM